MQKSGVHQPIKLLVSLAMLVAISIVCGKYLAIRGGDILRFSFENLPIIFAGVAFGPLSGAAVGVIADLIGCVLVGYAINPIVTLGAFAIGVVSGLCNLFLKRFTNLTISARVIPSTLLAHLVGSVFIKTFGLALFYGMPVWLLMLWRLLNYAIVGGIECALLFVLFKNKQIKKITIDIYPEKRASANMSSDNNFHKFANSFQAVTVPGLERIAALCRRLDNPQDKLKFIHVAGTNGKGSVCANLACILEEAGYKTGKYISPNLIKVNERISVNGEDIRDEDMTRILNLIEPLSREVEAETGIAPTQFEIWTALAFYYFEEQKCDYVVLEVGLGGEFDATNVIKANETAIITRLGLDHLQYLGNTLEEVAKAKSGIIKSDCKTKTVVTLNQDGNANGIISDKAKEKDCSVMISQPELIGNDGIYEIFNAFGINEVLCGIPGMHQAENASLAIGAALKLNISEEAIRRGIARAKNPARFELISENPVVIYDGGHNENGITALVNSLERYFPDTEKTVIFACMKDKDIGNSLKLLCGNVNTEFIFTTVKDNPRASSAKELSERAMSYGIKGDYFEDIKDAYQQAIKMNKLTVICGSLYLYKDLSEYLNTVKEA